MPDWRGRRICPCGQHAILKPRSSMSTTLQAPATTLLYNDWYPAMRSDGCAAGSFDRDADGDSAGSGAAAAMAGCLPCATAARIAAFRSRAGGSTASSVTCKYHGWEFEPVQRTVRARFLRSPAAIRWTRRRFMRRLFPARSAMAMRGCMFRSRDADGARRTSSRRFLRLPKFGRGIAPRI